MHNPILHAEMLAWRARCRSIKDWSARAWLIAALMTVLGIALIVGWWSFSRAHASWLLATAMLQPFGVLGLCAALTCYVAMHGRQRRYARFAQSWFTALALSSRQTGVALALPVAGSVLLVWLALAMTIAFAAAATAPAAKIIVSVQLCIFLGTMFGGLLGWWFGRKARHRGGRALAWRRVGKALARTDGLSIVSRWPLLHARSAVDPTFHARVFLPVLLGMPVGVPVTAIVFIIGMCGVTLLLIEIARGLLSVVPEAALWLRSTPLPTPVLIRTLGRRTGSWFIAWLVVTGAALIGLGLPLPVSGALVACAMLALVGACAWHWPRLLRA